MSSNIKVLTEKKQLGLQLKAIKGVITPKEKGEYTRKYGRAKSTVSGYLNGTVHNIDTAMEMLQFFNKRIKQRANLLKQIV